MKRRGFLASSLAASALAGTTPSVDARGPDAAPAAAGREYYELRRYLLRRGPQQKLIDDFYRDAAIPAMNRLGINPVGAFSVTIGPGSPSLYVLIPHASAESAATLPDRMAADPEYLRAGAVFINPPPTDPAYVRMESSLLVAFEGMPKLEVPPAKAENKPRIFELRTYESHSKKANRTKIGMFNGAEIAIFRRTGLHAVFFGETLIGAGMPSLTYMVTFADMEERTRNWAAFAADPEWKALSTRVGNTDGEIVSSITNVILSPAGYSQI
ncbi:MAG TPA: NIPSNAP family protein [Terriglobia bacterium]|nr:NIPSNAP family protein [Terriglobia bacterium]